MTLRPDQLDLVERINARFKSGVRSVLAQAGTGFGKTHAASDIIRRATARGYRTVFLAHLDALVEDTADRLATFEITSGFIQAGRPSDPTAPVQVASLQTLHTRGERPPADFLILDEAHRAMGATVRAILDSYPRARLLGLSATPQRSDGQPLGDVFQDMVHGPSNRWLTEQGHLVPCDLLGPEQYVDDLCEDAVDAYLLHTPGTRAIVFAANVAHAEDLHRRLNEVGVPTALVIGETSRTARRDARRRLRTGELKILVGCGVFIEGWDSPEIETVVLARGFGVPGAFLQSIGRGLRPSRETGKTKCTVLDLRGAVNLHGLPDEDRVWSLTGQAVRRTENMIAIRRCKTCWAMFRPQTRCPRCGAENEAIVSIPRVLSRAEKMVRWEHMNQVTRDERYFAALVRVASRWAKTSDQAARWAHREFLKRFGREPTREDAA